MNSPGNFVYDERDGGSMPMIDFGFDAANPATGKRSRASRRSATTSAIVTQHVRGCKADFDWQVNDRVQHRVRRHAAANSTSIPQQFERNTDTLNPTLLEAGAPPRDMGKIDRVRPGPQRARRARPTSFYVPDIDKFDKLFEFTAIASTNGATGALTNMRNGGRDNFAVEEQDTRFYLQFDFDTELFGRPFRGNVGHARRDHRPRHRSGGRRPAAPIVGTNNYTDWLPSMNLIYEPIDNVLVRFAASKVMARPLLGNLSPTISGDLGPERRQHDRAAR